MQPVCRLAGVHTCQRALLPFVASARPQHGMSGFAKTGPGSYAEPRRAAPSLCLAQGGPSSPQARTPPTIAPRSPGCSHTPFSLSIFQTESLAARGARSWAAGGVLGSLCSVPPGPFAHESLSVDFLSPLLPFRTSPCPPWNPSTVFENTSTLSQLQAAGRPGREAEGLLRLSSPLSLPGGQGCRVTFRLQAPCHASPAGLLLMNNKWAFLIHLLGTSCHYKPFCFF